MIYLEDLRGRRRKRNSDATGAVHQLLACDTTAYPQERDTLVGFAPSGRRGERWENVRESRRWRTPRFVEDKVGHYHCVLHPVRDFSLRRTIRCQRKEDALVLFSNNMRRRNLHVPCMFWGGGREECFCLLGEKSASAFIFGTRMFPIHPRRKTRHFG